MLAAWNWKSNPRLLKVRTSLRTFFVLSTLVRVHCKVSRNLHGKAATKTTDTLRGQNTAVCSFLKQSISNYGRKRPRFLAKPISDCHSHLCLSLACPCAGVSEDQLPIRRCFFDSGPLVPLDRGSPVSWTRALLLLGSHRGSSRSLAASSGPELPEDVSWSSSEKCSFHRPICAIVKTEKTAHF